ncbi:Salicylate biosynthesis isochorismate synthase [compost metagenome]
MGPFVEREHNITLSDMTNFLQSGALLRHRGEWHLIKGPFSPQEKPNSSEISVYCPDFYLDAKEGLLKGSEAYRLTTSELQSLLTSFAKDPSAKPLQKATWQEPAKSDFESALSTIQERIFKREIQKAVPVVFARSPQKVTVEDRALMILNLTKAPDTLFVYGFWQNDEGVIGATPEVLVEFEKGLLKTMALAGTCPKSESSERESLLQDAKEMQEHRLVLEDIVETLKPLGVVQASPTGILELPTLYHLKTDIQVQCEKDPPLVELIKRLHPTPALGVAPRSAGYQWMSTFPGQEGRARYGAPFAFFGPAGALCLVGIRNLQWNKDFAMIGSGCGVVAASEFEREWREIYQKRLSVRKILGLEA